MYEAWYIYHGTSTAYVTITSHNSVCLYVYPSVVAKQRLSKNFTTAMNTRNNKIIGRVVFYAVRVVSKESRRSISSCKNLLFI
jgi:hypothetical protein